MAKRDFYESLEVARGADAAELKKAYRRLAKQYHPDRNPGDAQAEKRFKEINEAYDVLKNDQTRTTYDQFGHAAFEHGGGPQGAAGGATGFGGGFSESMSDIFEGLFGNIAGDPRRRRRGPGAAHGDDLRYDLTISLEAAFAGVEKEIRVVRACACETCGGRGAKAGTSAQTCAQCGGAGAVRMSQGFFTMERTCPICRGEGRIITDPCADCHGEGRVRQRKKLAITIPAGIDSDMRLRVAGAGDAAPRGGAAGDLYVFVTVRAHKIFERRRNDLLCAMPTSLATAALGGEVRVPVVDGGEVDVKIPEGCQSGHRLRLRGKGMPDLQRGPRGDLYITVQVETPIALSARQKDLIRQLDKASGPENSPRTASFFTQVKRFFDGLRG